MGQDDEMKDEPISWLKGKGTNNDQLPFFEEKEMEVEVMSQRTVLRLALRNRPISFELKVRTLLLLLNLREMIVQLWGQCLSLSTNNILALLSMFLISGTRYGDNKVEGNPMVCLKSQVMLTTRWRTSPAPQWSCSGQYDQGEDISVFHLEDKQRMKVRALCCCFSTFDINSPQLLHTVTVNRVTKTEISLCFTWRTKYISRWDPCFLCLIDNNEHIISLHLLHEVTAGGVSKVRPCLSLSVSLSLIDNIEIPVLHLPEEQHLKWDNFVFSLWLVKWIMIILSYY